MRICVRARARLRAFVRACVRACVCLCVWVSMLQLDVKIVAVQNARPSCAYVNVVLRVGVRRTHTVCALCCVVQCCLGLLVGSGGVPGHRVCVNSRLCSQNREIRTSAVAFCADLTPE